MPPRRARAASAKPADDQEAPAVNGRAKPKSTAAAATTTRKRTPSKARSTSPPAKRQRKTLQPADNVPQEEAKKAPARPRAGQKAKAEDEPAPPARRGRQRTPGPTKAAATEAPKALPKPRAKTPVKAAEKRPQVKPYLNPLPTPPPKQRPGLVAFAWGAGNFGQFGMGPDYLGEFDKPKKNAWVEEGIEDGKFGEEGAGIESVASGGLHSVFVDERGTVWTCGVNDDAALGRVTQNVPNPEKPNEFLDVDELTSYPHPIQSLVDEGFRAVKVVAGDSINAALSDAGELRLWGSFRANEGSLGFSKALKHQFNPVPVTMDLINKPGDYEKIASVACGGNHILALTTYGNIFTWGAGEQCQLGRKVLEGRKIDGTTPRKIKVGKRNNAPVLIGAGMYHSFAVTEKGDVYGWGLNTMGQTGTGYYRPSDSEVVLPKPVIGLHPDDLDGARVIKIVGGEHHTLFLTSDGRVFACGRSNVGQLGLPDDHEAFQDREDSDFVDVPVQVPMPDEHDDDPVVDISCGPHSNMAVTRDGALYSWGQGTQGELGVPDVEVRTPRQIVRREGGSWAAVTVACGGQHTIGLFRKKQK